MSHTLTAKEQPLAKIFSDDYVFTIPGYQRPYAWGTEQAQELLDDLLGALPPSGQADLSEASPYFLGSIVLIKRDNSPEATVVDGQQRLTTLTLLLSAIRAAVADPAMQSDIGTCIYERGSLVKGTKARYRLSLRERDRDFFREFVQHEDGLPRLLALTRPLPDAQDRLRQNAQVLHRGLARLDQPELLRLVQFVITRCYLVTVATPDLDSAYRIFGVLNSRGLDLSATDILKAEILGRIPEAQRDACTQRWEELEENLGREMFGELFGHIRMVYRRVKPKSSLLKEFREHVGPADPQAFIHEVLVPMAQAFADILGASYASQRQAEAVNEHLHWLTRIEFKDWVPAALAFFVRHHNDPEAMLAFFADLERLAYAMLATRMGVSERIERFALLIHAVEQGHDLHDGASPLQLSPEEQHAVYEALSGPIYDTHSARALAVILQRLDRLLSDGSVIHRPDVISVEHVLPQTPLPNSDWVNWVPQATDRVHWVHRLGNLALLSRAKNSAAKNYDFDKKKRAYFTRGGTCLFALTTQVLQHPVWSLEVIQARHAALLATLEQHWRLHERCSKEAMAEARLAQLSALAQHGGPVAFELVSTKHRLRATALESQGQFVVQAGSQAMPAWIGTAGGYQLLREELVSSGRLAHDGDRMLFVEDVAFSSPSAAAAVVLGRSDNGRTRWRLPGTSITYALWQASLATGGGRSGGASA